MVGVALIGLFFQQLQPMGATGAIAGVVLLGAIAQVINWRNPRSYEMWAEYRGLTIQLYYSDSERRYQAVCRALIRARERAWLQAAPASYKTAAAASAAATQAWYTQAAGRSASRWASHRGARPRFMLRSPRPGSPCRPHPPGTP
jgi:hypothetical protein